MEKEKAYEMCRDHLHRYVLISLSNGTKVDGIVEGVDNDNLYLALPGEHAAETYRGFGYGYGFGYPYPYPYYPYYPRRRFRRGIFPLISLLGLSLLPYY
ncbi:MAG: hypothetical protein H7X86_11400 [Gorillibacterium sp.]|nr:hypothetical protein [Gorillibacterium sp.]